MPLLMGRCLLHVCSIPTPYLLQVYRDGESTEAITSGVGKGTAEAQSQYLKLLPPRNSRRSEVGGISLSCTGVKYLMNFSRR